MQPMNKGEIYLAGGCFWGAEHYLKNIHGVIETQVGYANGRDPSLATYPHVSTGETGFVETVKIFYDTQKLSLEVLLDIFYVSIDPTALNQQGNDIGTQYRTGIYYRDEADLPIIRRSMALLQKKISVPIKVEVERLNSFYEAEAYHQNYLEKNPTGYCHIDHRLFECAKQANLNSNPIHKPQLSRMQQHVVFENGTEPPFQNEYYDEFRKGIYVDITTGEPLFVSSDKFDAGCGWPSFSRPIHDEKLVEKADFNIIGRPRTEVRAKNSHIHLGHVFDDGPEVLGGLRYCINSAALRFIPLEEMEKEGYGEFIPLVK